MMRVDGINSLQTAAMAIAEALTDFQNATENQIPAAGNILVKTRYGQVIIQKDGTVVFDPNAIKRTVEEFHKGISYLVEPAGSRCSCCNGSGRG
jgi:hypothetical protein